MSERKVDVSASSSNISDAELLEQKKAERAAIKAKLVQVLDRGLVLDRFSVPLPEDKYGEWVPNDKLEIYRMESMGFKVDTEYAKNRALHDDGSGDKAIVGDVTFMTCDKILKEAIDEIRAERYKEANSPRGGRQREERDFSSSVAQQDLPDSIKSRIDSANLDDIKAAVLSGQ